MKCVLLSAIIIDPAGDLESSCYAKSYRSTVRLHILCDIDLQRGSMHARRPTLVPPPFPFRQHVRMLNPKICRRPMLLNSLTVCSILAIQSEANFRRIQIKCNGKRPLLYPLDKSTKRTTPLCHMLVGCH